LLCIFFMGYESQYLQFYSFMKLIQGSISFIHSLFGGLWSAKC